MTVYHKPEPLTSPIFRPCAMQDTHLAVCGGNVLSRRRITIKILYEDFQYALAVGATAPFYLAKLFLPHVAEESPIVKISSSRDRMSQAQVESYTAVKGGILALTHALAVSLAGRVRVNSISRGGLTRITGNT